MLNGSVVKVASKQSKSKNTVMRQFTSNTTSFTGVDKFNRVFYIYQFGNYFNSLCW